VIELNDVTMVQSSFEYPGEYYNTRSAEEVMPILIRMFNPGSILDVGCGNGSWLIVARQLGVRDVLGLDLEELAEGEWPLEREAFQKQDLSEPFDLGRTFDLVICLEVAEHLDPEAAETLVQSLVRHGKRVVFSAAIPRQGGEGHVNEQAPGYWQSLFNARGFRTYDDIRPLVWSNDKVFWWYRQNIFVAIHEDLAGDRPSDRIEHLVHPEIFWEKTGFLIMAEHKIQALEDKHDALENYWTAQDLSLRYHWRRILGIIKHYLFPRP
jgi:SAM-dependent methyltransferase